MTKIELSVGMECEIDERVTEDWEFIDLLACAEDPDLTNIEKFRATSKALDMLMGRKNRQKLLGILREQHDGVANVEEVTKAFYEISEILKKK